jgi:hypothetical protein
MCLPFEASFQGVPSLKQGDPETNQMKSSTKLLYKKVHRENILTST